MGRTSVSGELGGEVKGEFWSKLLEAGTIEWGLRGEGEEVPPHCSTCGLWKAGVPHTSTCYSSACPAPPYPLRCSQGPSFFRSGVIWSSLPANSQIL